DWEPHLHKMFDFWSSVMLTSGRYKGQPMLAHMRLKSVRPEHFDRWLTLFQQTLDDLCTPAVADAYMTRALRIADSLRMGMFFDPSAADPALRPA
ncbi:MAG TPA: group III truncated hemoglobin, partial [Parvibaculum sp.]